MIQSGFAEPAQMAHEFDLFESWSQICLKNLFM